MIFDCVVVLVFYFKNLGISYFYVLFIFIVIKVLMYGYDVIDVNEIEFFIGGCEGFERLVVEFKV